MQPRVVDPSMIELRVVGYASDDAQAMTTEVQAEYGRRYGGDGDISPMVAADFDAPTGRFLVLYADGEAAAMGGWRRGGKLPDDEAEIKRMFVRPQFARRGFARLMLAELERSAAEVGIARLKLETGTAQPEAIALYESSGYHRIEPFGFYAGYDDSVHLGKELAMTDDTLRPNVPSPDGRRVVPRTDGTVSART